MQSFIRYTLLSLLIAGASYTSIAQGDINAMEYFIDDGDVGIGANTPIPITNGAVVTESFSIPTASLSVGFHTVYFRVQDLGGQWSISNSRTFFVSTSNLTIQANIVDVEYFIDTDPGYGSGTSLGPLASTIVNLNTIIPTSGLNPGFHTFNTRALDSDGLWGDIESRSFYVSQSDLTTTATIVELRYYIDTDPGYGNGTLIPITNATNLDVSRIIATSTLSAGHHVLNLRSLDSDGIWSEIESKPFFIDAFPSGLITGVEYFYNNDPGYGNGSTFSIAPPAASIDQIINLPTTGLTVGPHELGIRMINDEGVIGMTDYYSFTLCDAPIASFSAATICVGSATNFIDTSSGTLTGDTYSWDFDGDGFEDSNTNGDQMFTFPTNGTYDAALTINRSGCVNTVNIQVQVESVPVADAGSDQILCTTNTTLAADTPILNEAGTWSILSGVAIITDPTSPTTTVTGITTNAVELIWTLTNTLGGCSSQSNVVLAVNLPITTVAQIGLVDIGQSINIDVQTSATINLGDLLTTSITTPPLNGDAIVQADGTIDYTPNDDAPSSDTFIFRITNQCGNFDEKSALITILNQAPVIDVTGFVATPDALELVFDLTILISDPNDNLDFSTLRVVTQPISGAVATIDINGVLNIDYRGITFSGSDQIEVEICDLLGVCTIQIITIPDIEVGGEDPPISVFNAVSPNGDGKHDFLEIENIEFYPSNKVVVFNRWGDVVYETKSYNNTANNFVGQTDGGNDLPSGTYYYSIDINNGSRPITGFVMLNK